MRMPFGKYAGEDIEDVPSKYLKWFLENIDPETTFLESIVEEVDKEYKWREKYNEHIA